MNKVGLKELEFRANIGIFSRLKRKKWKINQKKQKLKVFKNGRIQEEATVHDILNQMCISDYLTTSLR